MVGSIVRVPLSGRKVRGYVVETTADRDGSLKDIAALSSQVPVFDAGLLESLRWVASHYVAPLAVVLDRAAPPNLPSPVDGSGGVVALAVSGAAHPIDEVVRSAVATRKRPTTALIGPWQSLEWVPRLAPLLEQSASILVVAGTEAEVARIGAAAKSSGLPLVIGSGEVARELTTAWETAQPGGRLVVGTPRVASWQIGRLGLAIVLEEGRRAMKDRQTPTVHVRDMISTRSRIEGFSLVFYGPTPSVEVLAAGPEIANVGTRPWPLVEVVDRRDDAPGAGLLAPRSVAALRTVAAEGRRAFVFTHRRSSDSSMRCVTCRAVRTCATCGSRIGREEACRRCGRPTGPCSACGGTSFEEMGSDPERLVAEINRSLGQGVAGLHPTDRRVAVGTERDLTSVEPGALAVAGDVDGLMLGHNYRTSEEALRILARLAGAVERGSGRRLMIQTSLPDAALVLALRRGEPLPYLEGILAERVRQGFPPASEMLAIEVRGEDDPTRFDGEIKELGQTVLGPAQSQRGWRWLIQGSLNRVRQGLRPLVQRWRDSGATVRVDADPIDL